MNPSPPVNCIARLEPGAGGLPKLTLNAPDGARAEIYLHGAQVASWRAVDGAERLFLSRASPFRPGAAIWGGIPVAFPQFGRFGPLPLHGLVRLISWEWLDAELANGQASARFRLGANAASRRFWDHPFVAELTVTLGGSRLAVALSVTNPGDAPFDFTAGLHTYLAVGQQESAAVEGLTGQFYRDAAAGTEQRQTAPHLDFTGEVNRIYFDAPAETRLVEPGRITRIQTSGFRDVVVWNPGATRCAAIPDLEPDDYQRFVCVEAVTVGAPIVLRPGEHWRGEQRLLV